MRYSLAWNSYLFKTKPPVPRTSKMRFGFEAIVSDWFQDDIVALGKRLHNVVRWTEANGGFDRAHFDEQMTLDFMYKRQTLLTVRAGGFEPFVGAELDDGAIARALYDDGM
jgi:hypothetical protein